MREIICGLLWIGNTQAARDVKRVLGLGISAVIDLAMEEAPIMFPRDITYCRFPLIDGAGNTTAVVQAAIDTTASFVRGEVPTLVTCGGGMSRSPAIVAAALAAIDGTTPEQSLERIAAAGPHDVTASFWGEVREVSSQGRQ